MFYSRCALQIICRMPRIVEVWLKYNIKHLCESIIEGSDVDDHFLKRKIFQTERATFLIAHVIVKGTMKTYGGTKGAGLEYLLNNNKQLLDYELPDELVNLLSVFKTLCI
jgi:hypothetical protein